MPDTRDIEPEDAWELEVYRNVNNLCVFCGKPMTTTIFHDVPVCDEHKDGIEAQYG
jgi:hypothetical protein